MKDFYCLFCNNKLQDDAENGYHRIRLRCENNICKDNLVINTIDRSENRIISILFRTSYQDTFYRFDYEIYSDANIAFAILKEDKSVFLAATNILSFNPVYHSIMDKWDPIITPENVLYKLPMFLTFQ